jgi:hypothetical protein
MSRIVISALSLFFVLQAHAAEIVGPSYVSQYSGFSDCNRATPREFLEQQSTHVAEFASIRLGRAVAAPAVITTEFSGLGASKPWLNATTINHYAGRIFIGCEVIRRVGRVGEFDYILAHEFAHYVLEHKEVSVGKQLKNPSLTLETIKAEIAADEFAFSYLNTLPAAAESIANVASMLSDADKGFADLVHKHCPPAWKTLVAEACDVVILRKQTRFWGRVDIRSPAPMSETCRSDCYWYTLSVHRRRYGPF